MVDALNPSPVFEVRRAAFSYRSAPAVRGIDLIVSQGERLALLGANGSGKSTLLRLLAGLSFAQSGSVSFDGQILSAEQMEDERFFYRFRQRVGVVFQNPDVQLFNASVLDEVAFAPLQLKLPKGEVVRRVEAALELLQITELRHRAPHRLSGGEKKRVALASVLVMNPDVLLLDEPAGALDPRTQTEILELLSSWRDGSKTVVIATHDLDSLEEIADRCCLLSAGQIVAAGTPLTVMHDLPLLERAGLIRPHRHQHHGQVKAPHGHLHTTDI